VISIAFTPVAGDPAWGTSWVPASPPDFEPVAVRDLTKHDFIFEYFRVDVAFHVGDVDFSERAGYVTVLDFLFMLHFARTTLHATSDAVVDLSDRQEEWCFSRAGDEISLHTRYAARDGWHHRPGVGHFGLSELDRAVDESLRHAIELIFTRQPRARQNPYLAGLDRGGFALA
jgi:hypothetical protein